MSGEFSFAPINLGVWEVVHDRYPFREKDDIGLLERLQLRLKDLKKWGDVKIVRRSSYEELGKVDEFMWKLWTCVEDGKGDNEDYDGGACSISAKYLALELSNPALSALLRFMYTTEYDATLSVSLELIDQAKQLRLHPAIIGVVNKNVTSKVNMELLKDLWSDPTSTLSILQSPYFLDLSMAFIISNSLTAFTFDATKDKLKFVIPRKLLELLIPSTLQVDLDKYRKISTGNWQFSVRYDYTGSYYLNMAQDQLAEYLFHWALLEVKNTRPTTSDEIISAYDIQEKVGDLVKILNERKFENFGQEYVEDDKDGVPVFSSMGSHYYFMLSGSKCRDETYRKNLPAVAFKYKTLASQEGVGKSDEDHSSQSSNSSSEPPAKKKKFRYNKTRWPSLLTKQLEKAFDLQKISDVYFQVSRSSKRIAVNSFLLSLFCEKFFYYFKCNTSLFHNFYLGSAPLETAKNFLQMFYSVDTPPKDTLLDCMKLSLHLGVNSFLTRSYPEVAPLPITVENVTIKYCIEFICGDPTKSMQVLVSFMERNLPFILRSDWVGMFETKDLLTHLLSLRRSKRHEIWAILAVSRWLRYNFVEKDDPIYENVLKEVNFGDLNLNDLYKLSDDAFIKTPHEIIDLAYSLGTQLEK